MLDRAFDYVASNLTYRVTSRGRSSYLEFLRSGIVQTRLWGNYDFAVGDIWTADLTASVHRYFHSWLFISPWISLAREDDQVLHKVSRIAALWVSKFQNLEEDHPLYRRAAYHDEGTAQRVLQGIRLHNLLAHSNGNYSSAKSLVENMLSQSASLLLTDYFYSGLNNHGMIQSLALRDIASYSTWLGLGTRQHLMTAALDRLQEYFNVAFTEEGVHVEHSPSYHLMVLSDLAEHKTFLENVGHHGSAALEKILHSATDHSTHCILPNGIFLPLSDTEQRPLYSPHYNLTDSETFKHAATAGKDGKAPDSRTLIEPSSGYFFHRSAWGDPKARYLAFIAAYNGHYHKHSDDLHVYLWAHGYELLTEAGPYGYNSNDPYVKHGFSQWAHNNTVVDRQSLPRVDNKLSDVGITKTSAHDNVWTVEAYNKRFTDVLHSRQISVDDSISHIEVIDTLQSSTNHAYTLNWNIGPDIQIAVENTLVIGRVNGNIIFTLFVDSPSTSDIEVEHHFGRDGSRPLGWRFPKMNQRIPSSLLSFSVRGNYLTIRTTIDVVKPAGHGENLPIVPSKSTASTALQVSSSTPIRVVAEHNQIRLVSDDIRVRRTVAKLFNERGRVSTLGGQVQNIEWHKLPTGKYRLRIFPKHDTLKFKPYTTDWFEL